MKSENSSFDLRVVQPWLLQRCTVREGRDPQTLKTSEYLDLDYMGSAEFEFGSIPEFLRKMANRSPQLIPQQHTHNGETLYFFSSAIQAELYCKVIEDLLDNKCRMKERSGIREKETMYIGKGKKEKAVFDHPDAPYKFNVWFDLSNNVIIARSPEVLTNLKVTIRNSVQYMDEQKSKA